MVSNTQFCWNIIGLKYSHLYKGTDKRCWVCGGDIDENAFLLSECESNYIDNVSNSKYSSSSSICSACYLLLSNKSFSEYALLHPEKKLKINKTISWRTYSHVFFEKVHFSPSRKEWRELFLMPPNPPFLFCITLSGQKILLHRSKISFSKNQFFVQFEEQNLLVSRFKFAQILCVYEDLLNLGFSKTEIDTGNYNGSQIIKIGLSVWRNLEDKIKNFRKLPEFLLVSFCAQRKEKEKIEEKIEEKTEEIKEEKECLISVQKTDQKQLLLF